MTMSILGIGVLTWLTFLPVLGMLIVLLLPKERKDAMRWTALLATALQVVLAVLVVMGFDRSLAGVNTEAGMQFVDKLPWIDIRSVDWIGRIHIEYFLGIDGISAPMVLLTALISCVAVVSPSLQPLVLNPRKARI